VRSGALCFYRVIVIKGLAKIASAITTRVSIVVVFLFR